MSTLTLDQPINSPSTTDSIDDVHQRMLKLLRTEIDFIPNQSFQEESESSKELAMSTLSSLGADQSPSDLPSHLRRLCSTELLSREQERALFREMNYLKYRANVLRSRLDPDHIDVRAVEIIEALLAQAQRIRDHIIKANMRLVMSVVKKFVTPQNSFDEMLSDGVVTLMHAVEKFDYDRGFRFSTYAYRSIARGAFRTVGATQKEEQRITRDAEEWAFAQEESEGGSPATDQVWTNLRELCSSMLDSLDRRERFIIRSRYALGAHRKVRTFQCLADKLGVSKERVRQLEQRAVAKLRKMASGYEPDELFGAAMA